MDDIKNSSRRSGTPRRICDIAHVAQLATLAEGVKNVENAVEKMQSWLPRFLIALIPVSVILIGMFGGLFITVAIIQQDTKRIELEVKEIELMVIENKSELLRRSFLVDEYREFKEKFNKHTRHKSIPGP